MMSEVLKELKVIVTVDCRLCNVCINPATDPSKSIKGLFSNKSFFHKHLDNYPVGAIM